MKIVIVGGGCSGVLASIYSKNSNNEVIILERGEKILKKLLLTGNGRCNYYNDDQDIKHYHSSSSLIDKFISYDRCCLVLDFFNKIGIVPKIKNGYYYPFSNQASTIYDVLVNEVNSLGIDIRCNYLVNDIKKENEKFIINNEIICDKLVLATGSLSYPKTGSDGMGYSFLEKFNHHIVPVLPSLVQLESNMKYNKELDGVRSDAILSLYIDDSFIKKEEGEVQLTNYGISGICTFNLSYYVARALYDNKKCDIYVNFVPFIKENIKDWFNNYINVIGNRSIYEVLCRLINKKIVSVILKRSNIFEGRDYLSLSDSERETLFNNLCNFKYSIIGTKGYDNAQVCSGGVRLEEVNPKNFLSLIVPNLYILGELVDICGDCGGYNLTMCFMSGILAGKDLGGFND